MSSWILPSNVGYIPIFSVAVEGSVIKKWGKRLQFYSGGNLTHFKAKRMGQICFNQSSSLIFSLRGVLILIWIWCIARLGLGGSPGWISPTRVPVPSLWLLVQVDSPSFHHWSLTPQHQHLSLCYRGGSHSDFWKQVQPECSYKGCNSSDISKVKWCITLWCVESVSSVITWWGRWQSPEVLMPHELWPMRKRDKKKRSS